MIIFMIFVPWIVMIVTVTILQMCGVVTAKDLIE